MPRVFFVKNWFMSNLCDKKYHFTTNPSGLTCDSGWGAGTAHSIWLSNQHAPGCFGLSVQLNCDCDHVSTVWFVCCRILKLISSCAICIWGGFIWQRFCHSTLSSLLFGTSCVVVITQRWTSNYWFSHELVNRKATRNRKIRNKFFNGKIKN